MRDVQDKMYYIILHVITNATGKALEVVILENEECSRHLRVRKGLSESGSFSNITTS